MALSSYFINPANDPGEPNPRRFRKPSGVSWTARLRALKHLPQRELSSLVQIFNAIILTRHLPSMLKHAHVISILKPRKESAHPSSYLPISLLDGICILFGYIVLPRILFDVTESELMGDEQFWFRPRNSALHSPYYPIIPPSTDVRNVLPDVPVETCG